jgi:fibronectin-binding autotransporter adhesin
MSTTTISDIRGTAFRSLLGGLKLHLPARLALLAAALLLGDLRMVDAGLTAYWTDGTGSWSNTANWSTGTVPTSGDSVYVNNGGTATITGSSACSDLTLGQDSTNSGTVQMIGGSITPNNTTIGYSGTGTLKQSGGTFTAYYYLYLGYSAGSAGTYNLSGSGKLKTSQISGYQIDYGEYVGYFGTGTFNQTGGTNGNSYEELYVGYGQGSNGTYNLNSGTVSFTAIAVGNQGVANFNQSGGSVGGVSLGVGSTAGATYDQSAGSVSFVYGDNGYAAIGNNSSGSGTYILRGTGQLTADLLAVGEVGTGTFNQSAGTVTITNPTGYNMNMSLRIGSQSGGNGTYNLSGTGQLSSVLEYVGYDSNATALIRQTGGTNKTTYISIGSGGRYVLTGGTLDTTGGPGGVSGSGDIDASNSTATFLIGSNNIVDFGRANLTNVHGMNVRLGANALLIVPPGFDPATGFGTFTPDPSSIVQTAGTTLVVPAGKEIGGCASISDPVNCQGKITARSAPNTMVGINLDGGLTVSGTGAADLGYGGFLTVNDAASGMSGGSLNTGVHYVGYSGTGTFTHSGGTNTVIHRFILGYNSGDNGTYTLSGTGQLNVSSSSYPDYEDIGYNGVGVFNQSGGTNTVTSNGSLTLGSNRGSTGTYNLSGSGQLTVGTGSSPSANEYIGYLGNGEFNQSGGTNTVANILCIAYWPYENQAGNGTYNLTGGTLAIHAIQTGNGTATFNFGGGTLRATGNLTTGLPMTLTGIGGNANVDTNNRTVTLSGTLSGSGGLNKWGANTLNLHTANSYTGDTKIYGGTIMLTHSNALQGSTLDYNSYGGTLNFGSLISTTFGGLKGGQDLPLTNASSGAVALTVGGNNGSTTYSGALSGGGSLSKTGSGALTLTAANGYTGPTTVSGGRLVVNGSLAPSNALTVQKGGTLGGIGTVGGVTVNLGGHIAPGDIPGTTGTLTLGGNLSLASGALMDFDVGATSASDKISMPLFSLLLNNQQFSDFIFAPHTGFGPGVYTLIDAGNIQGKLNGNLNGAINGLDAIISTHDGDLLLTVVPEPSPLLLLGVGAISLLGCAWWRRCGNVPPLTRRRRGGGIVSGGSTPIYSHDTANAVEAGEWETRAEYEVRSYWGKGNVTRKISMPINHRDVVLPQQTPLRNITRKILMPINPFGGMPGGLEALFLSGGTKALSCRQTRKRLSLKARPSAAVRTNEENIFFSRNVPRG